MFLQFSACFSSYIGATSNAIRCLNVLPLGMCYFILAKRHLTGLSTNFIKVHCMSGTERPFYNDFSNAATTDIYTKISRFTTAGSLRYGMRNLVSDLTVPACFARGTMWQ